MLPVEQRLRRPADFQAVTKHGRRRKSGNLVAYLLTVDVDVSSAAPAASDHLRSAVVPQGPRAGLIVGKTVGNSVVRHRVTRQLREQLRQEIPGLRAGDRVVVRALTGAGDRSSAQIARDLNDALLGLRRSSRSRP